MLAMLRAVVLAAGASSRMGRVKAALPLSHPADTFLSRLLHTLTASGLPEIVVVTGNSSGEVRRAAGRQRRHVRFVHHPGWPAGQLTSLLAGVDVLAVAPVEGVLMTLVDVPLVSTDTVRRVTAAWRATRAPIVRPARGNEHGHPVIFDAAVLADLRRADPVEGAKAVVRAHAAHVLNVPVTDPGAFRDADTVADYAELRKKDEERRTERRRRT